jgi:hypothetical protein
MTQDHATPAPRRTLAVVRAGTEGGPAAVPPVPGGGTGSCADVGAEAVPVPAAVPMAVPERARLAVSRWAGPVVEAVRELWLHPDRLLYVMWHGKPESMAEHRAYMKSRAWVPPGMDGGAEKAVTGAGLFYHLLIARPLLAVANTVGAAAVRPLRLLCLAVLITVLIVLLARYL